MSAAPDVSAMAPIVADRKRLDYANSLFRTGHDARGWEILAAVLERHPWRPRVIRYRPPAAERSTKNAGNARNNARAL